MHALFVLVENLVIHGVVMVVVDIHVESFLFGMYLAYLRYLPGYSIAVLDVSGRYLPYFSRSYQRDKLYIISVVVIGRLQRPNVPRRAPYNHWPHKAVASSAPSLGSVDSPDDKGNH